MNRLLASPRFLNVMGNKELYWCGITLINVIAGCSYIYEDFN